MIMLVISKFRIVLSSTEDKLKKDIQKLGSESQTGVPISANWRKTTYKLEL